MSQSDWSPAHVVEVGDSGHTSESPKTTLQINVVSPGFGHLPTFHQGASVQQIENGSGQKGCALASNHKRKDQRVFFFVVTVQIAVDVKVHVPTTGHLLLYAQGQLRKQPQVQSRDSEYLDKTLLNSMFWKTFRQLLNASHRCRPFLYYVTSRKKYVDIAARGRRFTRLISKALVTSIYSWPTDCQITLNLLLENNWKQYRAVLSKCEFFIKMRGAESPPSFDLEKSFLNKSTLFLDKNHFLFYYLKLETPVFTDFRNYTDFLINLRDFHARQGCREREERRCFVLVRKFG